MARRKLATWFTALAAAFVLLLAGVSPAFADIAQNSTGTINVGGIEKDAQAVAYKIIDVNFDYTQQVPVEPQYTWDSNLQSWVKDNYKAYIAEDGSVTEAYSKLNGDDSKAFFDALAAKIKSDTSLASSLSSLTSTFSAGSGNVTINNASMGSYVVLIGGGAKVYAPSAVNVVPTKTQNNGYVVGNGESAGAVSVELKSTEPSVDKTVDEQQIVGANIGDTIDYVITGTVPTYPANSTNRVYTISDSPTKGLTVNTSGIKVYGSTQREDGSWVELATGFTIDSHTSDGGFDVVFTYDNIKSYVRVKVEYSATLNADAEVGQLTENTAKLIYSNHPYDDSTYKDGDDSTVTVYTYGIDVFKTNGDKEALTGAEFSLATYENSQTAIEFVKTADGIYRKAAEGDTDVVTTLAVGSDGHLKISGLADVAYQLTETKAPADYNKLTSPIEVTITAVKNQDGQKTASVENERPNQTGYVGLDVVNTQGFVLPTTGGMGTAAFAAVGVVLIGGGVALFVSLKKRNAER